MEALEIFLKQLKLRKSRDVYFECIRQIKDQMIDDFPLDKSMWMAHSDLNDALMQLEQSYKRVDFVKEKP
jgi:hypothetical protein